MKSYAVALQEVLETHFQHVFQTVSDVPHQPLLTTNSTRHLVELRKCARMDTVSKSVQLNRYDAARY